MAKQQFEVIQCHTGTLMLLWFGGLAAIFFLATTGIDTVLPNAGEAVKTASLVVFASIGYGMFRWGKKASAVPTQVVIDHAGLTIVDLLAGKSQQLPFRDITAYKHSNFNNVEELRITLNNGPKHEISINTMVHGAQTLGRMVDTFETALAAYQKQASGADDIALAAHREQASDADETPLTAHPKSAGGAMTTLRERTFFEKPISTVVLVVFTVFLVWAVLMMLTSNQSRTASLIGVLGGYFGYVAAWLAARQRRNQA